MSEINKCRELARLQPLLSLDKPIQMDFIEHAVGCEHCLFWTSYLLAINEAYNSVDRTYMDDYCPKRETFKVLLLGAVFGLRAGAKKLDKNIFYVPPGVRNIEELNCAQQHVNRDSPSFCAACHQYHSSLFAFAVLAQKRYESAIKSGEETRPSVINKTEEVRFKDSPLFTIPLKKGQKPN